MVNSNQDWFALLMVSIYNAIILGMILKWGIPEIKKSLISLKE